jgi:hypothetical protein
MYQWLVFVHLVGLVLFLMMHGVSMWAAFTVRRDPRPDTVRLLLGLSSRANQVMYLGLLLLILGGLGAAWNANQLTAGWIVASYVVFIAVLIGMWAMGAGFYYPLRQDLDGKDGAAPIEPAELARRLQNRRPEALTVVGIGGLLILVWLMVLKPF